MHDVNWWLMALAFVLGLVLTLAFSIRRVKREVPVSTGFGGTGAAGVAAAGASTAKMPVVQDEPYGAGSARAGTGGSGPSGWTVKGNENSMLYHTEESPSYKQTIAEIWFKNEESAVRGGFSPWHKGRQ